MTPDRWRHADWIEHSQCLLDSYARLIGYELLPREGSVEEQSRRLYHAPFVVLSHGVEADPILNYGNAEALALWEVDLPTFTSMPSRLTAEAPRREERARLLERVAHNGFIDDYSGIRISSTGKRFLIERATVWNLLDRDGMPAGQAATFSEWRHLDA